jgi:sugar phosphate isomerase/epimerase
MKVPYFKPGYWRYQDVPVEEKLAQVRSDLLGLAAIGRGYGIACGFHNHAGDYVGASVWDIREILVGTDPRWAGYYFDAGHATAEGGEGGWRTALRMALPRVKMVAVKDFFWEKAGGKWKRTVCPLGEGMVNWPAFFQLLAAAKWAGPISLHVEHGTPGDPATIARDLAFLNRQLDAAYEPPART